MKVNKRVCVYFCFIAIGISTFFLIELCKINSLKVEQIYSNYVFLFIAKALGKIFGLLPFSVWELIYVTLLLIPFYVFLKLIYVLIRRPKEIKLYALKYTKTLIMVLVPAYFLFNFLWGFNYYREPLINILGLNYPQFEKNDLIELSKEFIYKANELRENLPEDVNGVFYLKQNFSELSENAENGFEHVKLVNMNLSKRYFNTKPVVLSKLMSYTGITGMYSPFTGEANVNIDIPKATLPVTICHEQAHQRGIAKEEEANYVAYLACINNPNKEFQYSGYYLGLNYLMNDLYQEDKEEYNKLRSLYSEKLRRDLNYSYNYWKTKEGPIEKIWDKVNDSYLKSNNQNAGVSSYGFITKLLLAEFKNRIEN